MKKKAYIVTLCLAFGIVHYGFSSFAAWSSKHVIMSEACDPDDTDETDPTEY